jgi:hypothetical protein
MATDANGGRPDRPPTSAEARQRAERHAAERVRDRLVTLAGRAAADALDEAEAPPRAHASFLDWLARELRARQDPAERWSPERLAGLAVEAQARLAARRVQVRRIDHAPRTRPAAVTGSIARVLVRAAAECCAPRLDLSIAAGAGRDLWDEPCEQWLELPPDLDVEGQGARGFVALTVSGESMLPLLHPGDVVLVRLGPELVRDAVVVARRPDEGYVVKRVDDVGAGLVRLASLNPAFPPVTIPHDERLIVGTVVLRWCGH